MLYLIAFLKGLGFGVIAVVLMPILSIISFKEIRKGNHTQESKRESMSKVGWMGSADADAGSVKIGR
ncbi:hypothetical protein E0485_19255 [Paenibacillus albiflavus]|uniref:Uncharacterized protein n=1 Tax=Paenibacillus albiflavus TaxID=2545760 RepID=A0A4R4E510_9BACL|nr:hypothetical protein [Paenibacillus albiflavus]TCZ74706.1 hypothetical protein E0485_19255 [Paenibacillus albiflavus]